MVECYSGLYEKVNLSISMVWPSFLIIQLVYSNYGTKLHLMGDDCQSYKISYMWSHFGLFYDDQTQNTVPWKGERAYQCMLCSVGVLGGWDHWYAQLHPFLIIQNSIQPLCNLSHSVIIFQKAQFHISIVLFVAEDRTVLAMWCHKQVIIELLKGGVRTPVSCS